MGNRVLRVALALPLALACAGSCALLAALDQTALAGLVYLQAVNTGNPDVAMLLGDHYTSDMQSNQALLALDVHRDIGWLAGARVSEVTTSREQTLSGQWVTVVRFKWQAANSKAPPAPAALRVKTDRWLIFTYVRAVEVVEP